MNEQEANRKKKTLNYAAPSRMLNTSSTQYNFIKSKYFSCWCIRIRWMLERERDNILEWKWFWVNIFFNIFFFLFECYWKRFLGITIFERISKTFANIIYMRCVFILLYIIHMHTVCIDVLIKISLYNKQNITKKLIRANKFECDLYKSWKFEMIKYLQFYKPELVC